MKRARRPSSRSIIARAPSRRAGSTASTVWQRSQARNSTLARGADDRVAPRAVAGVDVADEPERLERVEVAVHGGDVAVPGELVGGERRVGGVEGLEDAPAGAGDAHAPGAQRAERGVQARGGDGGREVGDGHACSSRARAAPDHQLQTSRDEFYASRREPGKGPRRIAAIRRTPGGTPLHKESHMASPLRTGRTAGGTRRCAARSAGRIRPRRQPQQRLEPSRGAADVDGSDGRRHRRLRVHGAGRPGALTVVANWLPFEDPGGGPNFYKFDPQGPLLHQHRQHRRRRLRRPLPVHVPHDPAEQRRTPATRSRCREITSHQRPEARAPADDGHAR